MILVMILLFVIFVLVTSYLTRIILQFNKVDIEGGFGFFSF